jgi:hypothetical protein
MRQGHYKRIGVCRHSPSKGNTPTNARALRRTTGTMLVVVPLAFTVWMLGYLLVRSIRPSHQTERADTTAIPAATRPGTA